MATATLCSAVCSADATQTHSLRFGSFACSLFEARRWPDRHRPTCVRWYKCHASVCESGGCGRPSSSSPKNTALGLGAHLCGDLAHICDGDFAHICTGTWSTSAPGLRARSAVSRGVAYPWAAKARLDVPAQQISTVRLCGIHRGGQESARECRRVPSCWKAVGSWHGTGSGSDKHRRCDTKRVRSDMMAYQCRQVYHQSS